MWSKGGGVSYWLGQSCQDQHELGVHGQVKGISIDSYTAQK